MAIVGWGAAEEAAKNATGGRFIRLQNDGDKIVVCFAGEPLGREMYWDNNGYTEYTEEHRKAGKTVSVKFKINAFVPAEKSMKIWECSAMAFKDVLAVKKKYGLDGKQFEITRHGKKGDTKTTYSILPENPLDLPAELLAIMKSLPLHDLTTAEDDEDGKKPEDKKTGSDGFTTFANKGGDGLISAGDKDAIIARLKILPKAEQDRFLTRFGVQKVKELKASDLDLAKKFIFFLEGKGPNPDEPAKAPEKPAENDPFAD